VPTTILGVVPRDLASEGVVGRHLRQIPRQMENVAEMMQMPVARPGSVGGVTGPVGVRR